MQLCPSCKECLDGKRKTDSGGLHGHHWRLCDLLQALAAQCWICKALKDQLSLEQFTSLISEGKEWHLNGEDVGWFTFVMIRDTSDESVIGSTATFQFHLMFDSGVGEHLQAISRKSQVNIGFPALYLWLQPVACTSKVQA